MPLPAVMDDLGAGVNGASARVRARSPRAMSGSGLWQLRDNLVSLQGVAFCQAAKGAAFVRCRGRRSVYSEVLAGVP